MSKQTISVSKAGINTLVTRAAIMAAGNPKHQMCNPYQTADDQFDIEPALPSQFDLIFTIADRPSETGDEKIASHMFAGRDAAKRTAHGEVLDENDEELISLSS